MSLQGPWKEDSATPNILPMYKKPPSLETKTFHFTWKDILNINTRDTLCMTLAKCTPWPEDRNVVAIIALGLGACGLLSCCTPGNTEPSLVFPAQSVSSCSARLSSSEMLTGRREKTLPLRELTKPSAEA